MITKKIVAFLAAISLIGLAACNFPLGASASGGAVDTAVAMTLAAQASPTSGTTATLAPQATATPALTATSTLTPTPSVPMVSVSLATNCRSGPGTVYDLLGQLPVGQAAIVLGRDGTGQYWIINNPSNPGSTCWLWGQYATVSGNISTLPVIPVPPTPTPTITNTPKPTATRTPTPHFIFTIVINPCILLHNCPTATPTP